MALERWLAIASLGLFALFIGNMISVYLFMIDVPEDFTYASSFEADPKILQYISIGVAPACVLAAVAFIMSKRYGSKQVGVLIIAGGITMLLGMIVCYLLLDEVGDIYLTDAVKYVPILFMVLSIPVMVVGLYLFKNTKRRPKKEYF